MSKPSFEDSIHLIDKALSLRAYKWTLAGAPWLDWDDVCQIIRLHFWKKWHLYNENFPLPNWISTVISHQLTNITKWVYGNSSRPCLRCDANEGPSIDGGENLCSIYGVQCDKCPFFANWEKTKKYALDAKLPVTLENHTQEVYNRAENDLNFESGVQAVHNRAFEILTDKEYKVYKLIYIDGIDENEAAKQLGYKSRERGRRAGYKMIITIKNSILIKIKDSFKNNEIDY